MRTRRTDDGYSRYLTKATECLAMAQDAFGKRLWNASAISAIHAVISSCDALVAFYLGVRSAGERHDDVLTLLARVDIPKEDYAKIRRQISHALSIKNKAEYEDRLIQQDEAESILRDAERTFNWVKARLMS